MMAKEKIFNLPIASFLKTSLLQRFLVALFISINAFAGDLLAKYYKRKNNLKDYGQIILGHGRILDRFDSFILAGAA